MGVVREQQPLPERPRRKLQTTDSLLHKYCCTNSRGLCQWPRRRGERIWRNDTSERAPAGRFRAPLHSAP
eukprot:3691942-Alexandrium_andersonii.AAC.1